MINVETGTASRMNTLAIRTFKVTLKNIEKVNDFSDFALSVKI